MIKNILYLDEEKMYSLSSQIFEGVTESILASRSQDSEVSESQKGELGSGKLLGQIIKSSINSTEKKFLHDYSYTLFENHLINEGLVYDVLNINSSIENLSKEIENFSFIKIKGKAIFNDIKTITELLENFNSIGESITLVRNFSELQSIKNGFDEQKKVTKDKNALAKIEQFQKEKLNIQKLARENGLNQDPKFMESLSALIKYGFSDQLELQHKGDEVLFSSYLKRECLRENEINLVKKYSRKTSANFVVFGIISQGFGSEAPDINDDMKPDNMKPLLMNFVEHLVNIELSISGKSKNEIIIDPIAVYTDLSHKNSHS